MIIAGGTAKQLMKEKEEKREFWPLVLLPLWDIFGALPRVHFIHTIYRFEAREVRSPMLQTVSKSELKRKSYGHCKKTGPSWAGISHTTIQGANSSVHCARISHTSNQRAKLELQRANFPLFLPTPHEIFSFRYFCINFHSSPCNPRIIRFLS